MGHGARHLHLNDADFSWLFEDSGCCRGALHSGLCRCSTLTSGTVPQSPLDEDHKQLLTSNPNVENTVRKTVLIDGKSFPVLNQKDIDKLVLSKEPTGFIKLNQSEDLQFYVGIDKDGQVKNVQVVSGDQAAAEKAADALKL